MDADENRMNREQINREKSEIMIAARVCELRRLAADTARAYDEAVAARGLPPEHFRLRAICWSPVAAAAAQRRMNKNDRDFIAAWA